jgi:hypothetical protein
VVEEVVRNVNSHTQSLNPAVVDGTARNVEQLINPVVVDKVE